MEKIILLMVTTILTGVMIPLIVGNLQKKQSRDDAILQAQAQLLDDISTTILTYETLALDVSWFKSKEGKDDSSYKAAYKRYNERAVDLVAQWRAYAARAQTLVSPSVSKRIMDFLGRVFSEQDTPMIALHREGAEGAPWNEQHATNMRMLDEASRLIVEIAQDLNLSKDALAH